MLNDDQRNAFQQFSLFVAGNDKHFVISGAGGTGKSHLMRYIKDNWNQVEVRVQLLTGDTPRKPLFTATTNEAVFQLGIPEAETIYRLARLRPHGRVLGAYRSPDHTPYIVFVDEASYIGEQAFKAITKQLPNTKFVWVLDQDQLAPVGEELPYVTEQGFKLVELTKIERNQGDLQTLVRTLKQAVRNKEGVDIKSFHNGDSVQVVDNSTFQQLIVQAYRDNPDIAKVLGYTNAMVDNYNTAINDRVLGNPSFPYKGASAIVNTSNNFKRFQVGARLDVLGSYIETETHDSIHGEVELAVHHIVTTGGHLTTFVDKALAKKHKLNSLYTELSLPYASTTHKAQGSTVPIVFVDAKEIFSARDGELRRRLLYVAVSRASHKVIIHL